MSSKVASLQKKYLVGTDKTFQIFFNSLPIGNCLLITTFKEQWRAMMESSKRTRRNFSDWGVYLTLFSI